MHAYIAAQKKSICIPCVLLLFQLIEREGKIDSSYQLLLDRICGHLHSEAPAIEMHVRYIGLLFGL
jgi:hypothetical protein